MTKKANEYSQLLQFTCKRDAPIHRYNPQTHTTACGRNVWDSLSEYRLMDYNTEKVTCATCWAAIVSCKKVTEVQA